MPASKISECLGVSPSALSFHLKELAHAGMVEARQDGRYVYYSANYDQMNGLLAYLTENCCQGESCEAQCAPRSPKRKRA